MWHSLKRYINISLITIIILSMVFCVSAENKSSYYRYQGFSNLFLSSISTYGDIDSAIKASGENIYLPAGTYVIKKPIRMESGTLIGAGMDKTIIIADFENTKQPIIMAGSTPLIKDLTICYKDGLVTGKEKNGERVGIFCANYWALQKGASICNVKFKNIGTALYSPGTISGESIGITDSRVDYDVQGFSVLFENLVIEDFSFRGVDFEARMRTGNVWKNLYLSSGKFACDTAFSFEGEESECSMDLITIADTRSELAICFNGARALDAGSITLRNVKLIKDQTNYIQWSSSSGYIRHLSLNETQIQSLQSLVCIASTTFSGEWNDMNYLHIGTLTLSDVKGMSMVDGFNYFVRESGETDPFYITVDEYYYFADQLEKELYKAFPTSDNNLIYTKKGQLSEKGTTLLRPSVRLCPFYTQYYDTDIEKLLTWTGEEWK